MYVNLRTVYNLKKSLKVTLKNVTLNVASTSGYRQLAMFWREVC